MNMIKRKDIKRCEACKGTGVIKVKKIKSLADMLKACGNDWVNPDITEKNFPVKSELFTTEGGKVFHFDRTMTMTEIVSAIRSQGYEPAGIEMLLAYGMENPEEQKKHPIVALGSSWVLPGGCRDLPCLFESAGERHLSLDWGGPGVRWDASCRFLASRKS